jgi:hypothetical protein
MYTGTGKDLKKKKQLMPRHVLFCETIADVSKLYTFFVRQFGITITSLLPVKQRCFIIFLLWADPDVAVKAIICAFGHNDLSSPILENHARNGSSIMPKSTDDSFDCYIWICPKKENNETPLFYRQ